MFHGRSRMLALACLLLAPLLFHGRADAQPAAPARTMSLNGDWQFALAPNPAEAERMARFHEPSFDASAFRPLPVPANWALHGFEDPLYTQHWKVGDVDNLPIPSEAEGFYLHRFQAPADFAGKRVLLQFGGVWSSAEVWLNGQLLGRHDSGFTAFQFDVQERLRPGAENTLAVRVRQRTNNSLLDTNDDWALGGIYREVRLEAMPSEGYIERIETQTKFDASYRDATLNLRVFFGRLLHTPQPMDVRVTLADGAGAEVARAEHAGAIKSCGFIVCGQEVPFALPVRAPRQWTAETPELYQLRVDLLIGGRVVHTREMPIGFREVSTAGGVLTVNGQPVRIRGVGRHDLNPEVGRATRPEDWLRDIQFDEGREHQRRPHHALPAGRGLFAAVRPDGAVRDRRGAAGVRRRPAAGRLAGRRRAAARA